MLWGRSPARACMAQIALPAPPCWRDLVWGRRVATDIGQQLAQQTQHNPDDIPSWSEEGLLIPDPALISQDMSSIQHIMWNYVGLARTTDRLERAIRELRHLETEIEGFYRSTRLSDELIGLRHAVRTALIVTLAAWSNKQSMGSHYRT